MDKLYNKYIVRKSKDNSEVKNCFVLVPQKDVAAVKALKTYARETSDEVLSNDILEWIYSIDPSQKTKSQEVTNLNEIKDLIINLGWKLSYLKEDLQMDRYSKENNIKSIEKAQDELNNLLRKFMLIVNNQEESDDSK